jgi:hypothetical protein
VAESKKPEKLNRPNKPDKPEKLNRPNRLNQTKTLTTLFSQMVGSGPKKEIQGR